MCGIAGIYHTSGAPVSQDRLTAMAAALRHRGPDDHGLWVDNNLGLAHRRLSIIDLSGGHQPMATADENYWIVFNGEIYNHLELRRMLEARGCSFRTRSDTEVLLYLYEAFGEQMPEKLLGMFAFAIYDRRRQILFLARDRMGQKPLFYFFRKGTFAFASELQALREAPGFPSDLRLQSVHDYLTYQCIPGPDTIYAGVKKLPPANRLTVRVGQADEPVAQPYWSLSFREKTRDTFAESAAHLRHLLEEATESQLISDVPLGAFLSGGIDSTAVTGLMTVTGASPVKTFCIGFPDAQYDERDFARIAAQRFNTAHAERVVRPNDFEVVRKLVRHYGEPYADASMLPTYLLAQFTRETVTVALSGDGADELFGGYERYQAMRLCRILDLLPAGARAKLAGLSGQLLSPAAGERTRSGRCRRFLGVAATPEADQYFALLNHVPEALKFSFYGPRLQEANLESAAAPLRRYLSASTAAHAAEQVAEADLHLYLPDDILTKVDIASMAVSLEVRSPFMDHRVVEYAATLPWSYKQTFRQRKRVLLRACHDLLPPEIRGRGKMGFGVPLARWFREEWQPLLREILLAPEAAQAGFFQPAAVQRLVEEHVQGIADHSYPLWALLIFELWRREFKIG